MSACAFNKGKLRVLATSSDPQCGGRDIDMALADYFCQEFITKYKLDARKNQRYLFTFKQVYISSLVSFMSTFPIFSFFKLIIFLVSQTRKRFTFI